MSSSGGNREHDASPMGEGWRPTRWAVPEDVARLLDRAEKAPLLPTPIGGVGSQTAPALDRPAIEALLPHRDPFLFVDSVLYLDLEAGMIAARYDLSRASAVLAGHFPGDAVWPGVLQVEAVAQAGGLLYLKQSGSAGSSSVTLTHILSARFLRPVRPGADLEIIACATEDGLFVTIVGQCVQGGKVCSVAALRALS